MINYPSLLDSAGIDRKQYKKDYRRGWRCSAGANGSLDNHNCECAAWYDGYFDYAAGREKWHSMICTNYDVIAGHNNCNNYGGVAQED